SKARGIVFHLLAGEDEPQWPRGFLTDSLQQLLRVNRTYLVPFLNEERYGFMDEKGREVIAPRFRNIHSDYLCGRVMDEILLADHQLVARNGATILREHVLDVADIGAGFLKVETANGLSVIHKSGYKLADSVDDARVLLRRFVALK